MNEVSRIKKNPLTQKNSHSQKITLTDNHNLGPKCIPKNPPNISQFYNQLPNTTKKKQTTSRDNKYRQHIDLRNPLASNDTKHCQLMLQKQRPYSRMISTNTIHRISNSKKEKKPDMKNNKNTKQIHHINKPHRLKPRGYNKQNRPPRSTLQSRDDKMSQASRMGKTEAFQQYDRMPKCSLVCNEKMVTVTKIKKKLKQFSQEIKISASYQLGSYNAHTAYTHNAPLKNSHSKSITHTLTPQQQIAQFEKMTSQMHSELQSEALTELFLKQKAYFTTSNFNCYLDKKQPYLTWSNRAVVINWMMEISQNFGCRRQSLAIAVNILDRYLALSHPIRLQQLQKIACGCLCISNKVDGIIFNIQALSQQTQNISTDQIIKLEQQISLKLQFKLNPPTSNMWANRISLQWDMYLDHSTDNNDGMCSLLQNNLHCIKFKTEDPQGYNNFRSLMQYVDLSIMDVHTLRYHSRQLAASFIYLILNLRLGLFQVTQIYQNFPVKSDYLIKDTAFNQFYCQFLMNSFGFTLQDLLPTIQFCSTFFILNLCFRLPMAVQQNNEEVDLTFEELCSYQTSNQSNKDAIKNRDRRYD